MIVNHSITYKPGKHAYQDLYGIDRFMTTWLTVIVNQLITYKPGKHAYQDLYPKTDSCHCKRGSMRHIFPFAAVCKVLLGSLHMIGSGHSKRKKRYPGSFQQQFQKNHHLIERNNKIRSFKHNEINQYYNYSNITVISDNIRI